MPIEIIKAMGEERGRTRQHINLVGVDFFQLL